MYNSPSGIPQAGGEDGPETGQTTEPEMDTRYMQLVRAAIKAEAAAENKGWATDPEGEELGEYAENPYIQWVQMVRDTVTHLIVDAMGGDAEDVELPGDYHGISNVDDATYQIHRDAAELMKDTPQREAVSSAWLAVLAHTITTIENM